MKTKCRYNFFVYFPVFFIVGLCISQAGGWTSVSAYSGTQITGSYNSTTHHFSTGAPYGAGSGNSFNVVDNPYDPSWGAYGTGYVSPTSSNNFATQTVNMASVASRQVGLHGAGAYSFLYRSVGTGTNTDPQVYMIVDVDSSGVVSIETPSVDSSITPSGPLPNANTLTTSVSYSADYYLSTSSSFPLLYTPTKVEGRFTRLDVSEASHSVFCTITVTDMLQTCSGTITLTSGGRYSLGWAMEDDSGNIALIHDPYQFGVVSATDLPALVVTPPDVVSAASCDTWDFACYLKNAFAWAFVPSSDSISQFTSLGLQQAFPFSYLYDFGSLYTQLFSNSGSMQYAVSVPFLGHTLDLISASQISAVPYASTIKTLLGYLLYFYTGFFLYRLLLKAHD